jgi:adenosylcobinamide-phosphate synthase
MTPWQFVLAFASDLAVADPVWMPHPVQLFGWLTQWGERAARAIACSPRALKIAGAILALAIPALSGVGSWFLLKITATWSPRVEWFMAIYFAYTTLSIRGLDRAGKKVVDVLARASVAEARALVAGIVGRDTEDLDEAEILRAVVESVAENTCDGVVAPLFYLALGGVPAALAYKAINTLDSMIGYRNARYLDFGRVAARLDDVVNFVPARLTALLVVAVAPLAKLSWIRSLQTVFRDARLQPSPNSGFPEAAYAGALGIRLGGVNGYGGRRVTKAYLGDARRELTCALYVEVRRLLYLTSTLAWLLALTLHVIIRVRV